MSGTSLRGNASAAAWLALAFTVAATALATPVQAAPSAPIATLTYPTNGSTTASTGRPFTWNAATGALAYVLYLGRTPGTDDLFDSYETQATSVNVPGLPLGVTIYARIWTKSAVAWKWSDSTFVTATNVASLTYPADGQTNVDTSKAFTWTAAPGSLAFTLYLGTSQGAQDLLTTGEVSSTSVTVRPLPAGRQLWARMWTHNPSGWMYRDSTFVVVANEAFLTYPTAGSQSVNTARSFTWTPAEGATGYSISIGTTQGGGDLYNSGPVQSTSVSVPALPAGQTLWGRLRTINPTGTVLNDISFVAAERFVYPPTGSVNASAATPFRWAAAAVVNGTNPTYTLTIGTSPGGADLFDSGLISATTLTVPVASLPAGRVLYARIVARLGDRSYRKGDTVFMAGGPIPTAALTYPGAGQQNVDLRNPFSWAPVDVAAGYQLQILSNGAVVRDSGVIRIPRYFAGSLAPGTYVARLATNVAGHWYSVDTTFTAVRNGRSSSIEVANAQWATDFVRHMADVSGFVYQFSELSPQIETTGPNRAEGQATCGQYSTELMTVLAEMNVAAMLPAAQQPRIFNVTFNTATPYDGHVMVEFFDTDDSEWIVLDPTFAIAMTRTSDGRWATKEDAHAALATKNWGAIGYVSLGSFGMTIARNYYLDYPLLFNDLPPLPGTGAGADPVPYMTAMTTLAVGQRAAFMVSSPTATASIVVDGVTRTFTTDGVSHTSVIFNASTISLPAGSTQQVTVWRVNRFVF